MKQDNKTTTTTEERESNRYRWAELKGCKVTLQDGRRGVVTSAGHDMVSVQLEPGQGWVNGPVAEVVASVDCESSLPVLDFLQVEAKKAKERARQPLTEAERDMSRRVGAGERIVCLHVLGQGLVDQLCEIIRKQGNSLETDALCIARYAKAVRESAILVAGAVQHVYPGAYAHQLENGREDLNRALRMLRSVHASFTHSEQQQQDAKGGAQ